MHGLLDDLATGECSLDPPRHRRYPVQPGADSQPNRAIFEHLSHEPHCVGVPPVMADGAEDPALADQPVSRRHAAHHADLIDRVPVRGQRQRCHQHRAGSHGSSHRSPRAIRPHQFSVRVPQRNGHHPLCHEQSGRRATRPRTARGTRDARRLDNDRLLLPHRNQHDQTRRRRRPYRRRTPRSPAAGPAQTPPTRRCRNSTRRRPHSPFAARHGAGPVETHLGATGTHRPRTGSTSGPQPTNPGRTHGTREPTHTAP